MQPHSRGVDTASAELVYPACGSGTQTRQIFDSSFSDSPHSCRSVRRQRPAAPLRSDSCCTLDLSLTRFVPCLSSRRRPCDQVQSEFVAERDADGRGVWIGSHQARDVSIGSQVSEHTDKPQTIAIRVSLSVLTLRRLPSLLLYSSIPNLFMPLVGGLFLDHRGSAQGTMACLALCLLGHLGFVVSCTYRSFGWALVSRIIFGLGQGSTVVAQGRIIATWFCGREIVFAVALSESTHNLSNWIAFIYVVPVSEALGGYIYALWFGLGFCVLSFVAGAVFFSVNHEAEPNRKQIKRSRSQQRQIASPEASIAAEEDALIAGASHTATAYNTFADADAATAEAARLEAPEDVHTSTLSSSPASSIASSASASDADDASPFDAPPSTRTLNPLAGLSIGFAILCLLHMLYSNCFHLFAYVAPTLIQDRFHTGIAKAGWLAGLSNGLAIFLCPLAGLAMDFVGYKMWIQVIAGVLTTLAYLMLLSATVSPIPSLVLLALCVSFTPTILKSSVPNLVLPAVYGSVSARHVQGGGVCANCARCSTLMLIRSLSAWSLLFFVCSQLCLRHLRNYGIHRQRSWEQCRGFLP